MTKKVLIVTLVSAILSLCCGFCFAASGEADTVNLGNEVSSSLNKGADAVGNVANDMVGAGQDMLNGVGDAFRRMGDDNNGNNNNNNNDNNNMGMWNNNGTTTTDGYSTTRTTTEGTQTTNGAMSTTTWMWIIFAVAAVIIIAAIWYYAMQGNDRD